MKHILKAIITSVLVGIQVNVNAQNVLIQYVKSDLNVIIQPEESDRVSNKRGRAM